VTPLSDLVFIADAATSVDPLRFNEAVTPFVGPWGAQVGPRVDGSSVFSDRHGDAGNALFMDGHASTTRWDELAGYVGDADLSQKMAQHWNVR